MTKIVVSLRSIFKYERSIYWVSPLEFIFNVLNPEPLNPGTFEPIIN